MNDVSGTRKTTLANSVFALTPLPKTYVVQCLLNVRPIAPKIIWNIFMKFHSLIFHRKLGFSHPH